MLKSISKILLNRNMVLVMAVVAWLLMPDRELFYGFVVIVATPPGLFWLMVKVILIPFVLSRALLVQPVFWIVEKVRGQVVNWGFALIIFVAVGMNRQVFFGDFILLLLISTVLLSSLFGMGSLYQFWSRKRGEPEDRMLSRTLLITIKSSGFAAVTAFSLFGNRAAIPSAVMAVTVLMYLLFLSFRA